MVIRKINSVFARHGRVLFGVITIVIVISFMGILRPGGFTVPKKVQNRHDNDQGCSHQANDQCARSRIVVVEGSQNIGGASVCVNRQWGGKPAWRCKENRRHHQKIARTHLRLQKMRAIISKRELKKLDKIFNIVTVDTKKLESKCEQKYLFD